MEAHPRPSSPSYCRLAVVQGVVVITDAHLRFIQAQGSCKDIIQEDKYIYTHTNHVHLCPLRTIGVKHRNFLFFSHRVLTKHLAGTIDEYMPCCQQLIVILENLI